MSATLEAEPVAEYLSAECGVRSAECERGEGRVPGGSAIKLPDLRPGLSKPLKGETSNDNNAGPPKGGTLYGGCPVLISEGQSFPVEVRYLSHHDERPVTEQAADL